MKNTAILLAVGLTAMTIIVGLPVSSSSEGASRILTDREQQALWGGQAPAGQCSVVSSCADSRCSSDYGCEGPGPCPNATHDFIGKKPEECAGSGTDCYTQAQCNQFGWAAGDVRVKCKVGPPCECQELFPDLWNCVASTQPISKKVSTKIFVGGGPAGGSGQSATQCPAEVIDEDDPEWTDI